MTDSSLTGQTLALRINHDGASEIFINGIKKGGYGKIGPNASETVINRSPGQLIPFDVTGADTMVIAIRYANYTPVFSNFIGFETWIGRYNDMLPQFQLRAVSGIYMLISSAAMFAFALLHLFLFVFYRKQKANLYYALFVLLAASTQILRYLYEETSDPRLQSFSLPAFDVAKTLTTIFGGLLLYRIAEIKLTRLRLLLLLLP